MRSPRRYSWKEFEGIVERIQRSFHRGATVTRNERVLGTRSKTQREIDIAIRYMLGTSPLLIVVECKRYGRKVNVEKVDAFINKLKDVGAHLGVMVAEVGFSKGALNLAKSAGVETYTLADTRSPDWVMEISVPVFVELNVLKFFGIHLIREDGTSYDVPEGETIRLFDKSARDDEVTIDVFLRQFWTKMGSPLGRFGLECDAAARADNEEEEPIPVKMHFEVEVNQKRFIRAASLEMLGLIDGHQNYAHTDAFSIITDPYSTEMPYREVSEWPKGFANFGMAVSTTLVRVAGQESSVHEKKMTFIASLLQTGSLEVAARLGKPTKIDLRQ